MSTLVHGRASTYQRHACRCDECRAAQTAATKAWRATETGRQKLREVASTRAQALEVLRRRHLLEYREIVAAVRAGEVVE